MSRFHKNKMNFAALVISVISSERGHTRQNVKSRSSDICSENCLFDILMQVEFVKPEPHIMEIIS